MQPAVKLVDREAARKQFTAVSKLNKRSQVLEILSINNQLVICLLENGRCSIHNLCKCYQWFMPFRDQENIFCEQMQPRVHP